VTTNTSPSRADGGLRGMLRGGVGIAIAMAVMNVTTYGFQMVSARILGPADYGAFAGLTALMLVMAVLQLGLQATAARRISADPGHVAEIEAAVLSVTLRTALALGVLMLALSPVVVLVLRLDSIVPALLLAVSAVPLSLVGGQAGILQGERRWLALASLYLSMGVSRLLIGTVCVLVSPSESSAMLGIMLGLFVPITIGWWVLRAERPPVVSSQQHGRRVIIREVWTSSVVLLAFYALCNLDIVVARNVLSSHDAGLYAGGLIVAKAVLFLPQFIVVLLFPSMSTHESRRTALVRGLAVVLAMGAFATAAAYLLSGFAMTFIGGADYADAQSRLWLFAVIGTLLASLQLIVYSVLGRQGVRSKYVLWLAVVVLAVVGALTDSLTALAATVAVVDGVVVTLLLAGSLWSLRPGRPPG
jgi:O-antigen/teichoic acid export membrane protein